MNSQALIMSRAGMPSVMQTTRGMPGIDGFHDGVGREGRRNEDDGGVGAGLFDGFFDGVENGKVEMRGAAFPGGDAADYVGAVGDGLGGVERAFACR